LTAQAVWPPEIDKLCAEACLELEFWLMAAGEATLKKTKAWDDTTSFVLSEVQAAAGEDFGGVCAANSYALHYE
jgi:hypothetical protein